MQEISQKTAAKAEPADPGNPLDMQPDTEPPQAQPQRPVPKSSPTSLLEKNLIKLQKMQRTLKIKKFNQKKNKKIYYPLLNPHASAHQGMGLKGLPKLPKGFKVKNIRFRVTYNPEKSDLVRYLDKKSQLKSEEHKKLVQEKVYEDEIGKAIYECRAKATLKEIFEERLDDRWRFFLRAYLTNMITPHVYNRKMQNKQSKELQEKKPIVYKALTDPTILKENCKFSKNFVKNFCIGFILAVDENYKELSDYFRLYNLMNWYRDDGEGQRQQGGEGQNQGQGQQPKLEQAPEEAN